MAMQMFKEQLNGKYHGVAPATLLGPGGIADGQNMRKVSQTGGWKSRKGVTLHNTTAIAAASVLSLHEYTHPRNGDYHFMAQCNGSLYDATNDPPAAGTTFAAAALSTLPGTANPGWGDVISESWLYADGESAPVMWGGDAPYCTGFSVWDNSETAYIDYTRVVTDNRAETSAVVLGAASDLYYVCAPCIAKAIQLVLGAGVNTSAATITVKAWRATAWAAVTAMTDGTLDTATSTKTHNKSGTISWTAGADTMRVINGIMGFWYQISFSGALSNSVDVISCKVQYDPAVMSNKWSGVYETPLAVRFYDQSLGQYVDYSGKLTNESTSMYLQLHAATTSDFIYVKAIEPLTGLGFGVVDGYAQTGAAKFDNVEYWDGDSWNTNAGLIDETLDSGGTKSLSQTGVLWWDATGLVVKRRTMAFDSTPGFWYRVSWDTAWTGTATDLRVYIITSAAFPVAPASYKGVIEFKGRAFVWPDPEFPNRLRYSAKGRPDCLSGSDSGYTDEFGDMTEIVACARFYNELIVWKKNSVWLLEGYAPENFGTLKIADTIGCCAPKTAHVVETGFPSMHADEPLSIAIWMDTDGIYVLDGRKPRKVSLPIDQFFNAEFSTVFAAANLGTMQAYIDKFNNEYHLLPQTTAELVYNFITDEWYPPWVRRIGGVSDYLVCGLALKGTDGRNYSYGGSSAGFVFRLENDTTDKDDANADVVITQKLKTRAICAEQKQSTTMEFTFRKMFVEAKARASGSVTTNFYKSGATSGVALTVPAAISLVSSGSNLVVDGIETSQGNCKSFQLEFVEAVADVELEIYSFLYLLEIRGEFLT